MIDINDIAHALSNTCRFSGHVDTFYSVAEHSLLVSLLCKPENALAALLHDVAEYVLTDIPSPFKALIPDYKELEERVMRAVLSAFNIDCIPDEVHIIDKRIVLNEADVLFKTAPPLWIQQGRSGAAQWKPFSDDISLMIEGMCPQEAKSEFLQRFHELYKTDTTYKRSIFATPYRSAFSWIK